MHTGPARTGTGTRGEISSKELMVRWHRQGDKRAREQLVVRYLPLARKLARRYRGAREPLDDLEQVASLGLVKAIDRYDPELGNSFSSFAVPTILGEIKRYFRDSGWAVHMPRGIQELALRVDQARRTLASRDGSEPTYAELAEYLELGVEDVLDAVEAAGAHHAISFDTPHEDGEGSMITLGDSLGSVDERFDQVDLGVSLSRAISHLSERERLVLALRFNEDQTQSEIAEAIGVSQMQVSRVLRRALERMSDLMSEAPAA